VQVNFEPSCAGTLAGQDTFGLDMWSVLASRAAISDSRSLAEIVERALTEQPDKAKAAARAQAPPAAQADL
jgi:hypothetical protein